MERRLIGVNPKSAFEKGGLESLDPNARIYRILANPEGKQCADVSADAGPSVLALRRRSGRFPALPYPPLRHHQT
jgi:hypothetical protein